MAETTAQQRLADYLLNSLQLETGATLVKFAADGDVNWDSDTQAPTSKAIHAQIQFHTDPLEAHQSSLYEGGIISSSTATSVTIGAGKGIVVSTTDTGTRALDPSYTLVNWIEQTFEADQVPGIFLYEILINSLGIVESRDSLQPQYYRDFIILGFVSVVEGNVVGFYNAGPNTNQIGVTSTDLINFLPEIVKKKGFSVAQNEITLMTLDMESGERFIEGANWNNDKKNPNVLTYPQTDTITWAAITQLGVLEGAGYTTIDPNKWDNEGVIETVQNNRATIQYLWISISGTWILQYGQTVYDNVDDARLHSINDLYTFKPAPVIRQALILCQIIVDEDCADLDDLIQGEIINIGFGPSGGGGGLSYTSWGAITGIITDQTDLWDELIPRPRLETLPVTENVMLYTYPLEDSPVDPLEDYKFKEVTIGTGLDFTGGTLSIEAGVTSLWNQMNSALSPKTITNKLGIGLNNPTYLVEIQSAAVTEPAELLLTTPTGPLLGENKYSLGSIYIGGKDSSSNASGVYAEISGYAIDANTEIQASQNEGGQLELAIWRHDATNTPRVRYVGVAIDNYARVGIGTTSPLEQLHVDGTILFGDGTDAILKYDSTISSGGSYLTIQPSSGNQTAGIDILPAGTSTTPPAIFFRTSSTRASGAPMFTIGTGNASLPTDRWILASIISGQTTVDSLPIDFYVSNVAGARHAVMSIINTDRVGIMTTAPDHTLDVIGTGHYSDLLDMEYATGPVFQQTGTTTSTMSSISYPTGAQYSRNTASTIGAIRITFPTRFPTTMIRFWVDIYAYTLNGATTNTVTSMMVQGYTNAAWSRQGAVVLTADNGEDFTVRYGSNATDMFVYIGELTDNWGYPKILIRDIMLGHTNAEAIKWYKDWSITINNSAFEGVTITETENLPKGDYNKLINVPTPPDGSKWTQDDTNDYLYPKESTYNVGIGTTSPAVRLDLGDGYEDKFRLGDWVEELFVMKPSPPENYGFYLYNLGTVDGLFRKNLSGGNQQVVLLAAADGTYNYNIWGISTSVDGGSNWFPRVVMTQSGTLAIGTAYTSSTFKLDVAGRTRIQDTPNAGTSYTAVLVHDNGSVEERTLTELRSDIGFEGQYWERNSAGYIFPKTKGDEVRLYSPSEAKHGSITLSDTNQFTFQTGDFSGTQLSIGGTDGAIVAFVDTSILLQQGTPGTDPSLTIDNTGTTITGALFITGPTDVNKDFLRWDSTTKQVHYRTIADTINDLGITPHPAAQTLSYDYSGNQLSISDGNSLALTRFGLQTTFDNNVLITTGYTSNYQAYVENGLSRVGNPKGGSLSKYLTGQVGYIKIRLPIVVTGNNTMINFWIDWDTYAPGSGFSAYISGYPYSAGGKWGSTGCITLSESSGGEKVKIRLGIDEDDYPAVWIGESTTSWSYLKVQVRDVMINSNSGIIYNYWKDWVVEITATGPTTTDTTFTDRFPYSDYNRMINKPTTFPPSTHGLVSSTHTVSGLTTGHVLTALSATAFGFSVISVPTLQQVTDVGNTTTEDIIIKDTLYSAAENLDVDSAATEVIATVPHATYDAVFFDYSVKNGSNLRAGTVITTHDGVNTVYTDTGTTELGNTTGVVFSTDISGTDLRLLATVSTDNWVIKTIIRAI